MTGVPPAVRKMSEEAFLKSVMDLARRAGWLCVRPAQRQWLDALAAVEADAAGRVIVREWRPSQWDEIVRLLTGRSL